MSRLKGIAIHIVILGLSVSAFAFDPFTALSAVDSVEGFLNKGSEAADLGESITELMDESEIDEDLVKEADANVKRLEDMNRQVRELKYANYEIKDSTEFDLSRSKNLASKLRTIAAKVRQGKKLLSMFSIGKGGSNTGLQIEQVKLDYRMLDELRNLRLTQFNHYLEDKERKVRFQVTLEQALEEERQNSKQKLSNFKSKRGIL